MCYELIFNRFEVRRRNRDFSPKRVMFIQKSCPQELRPAYLGDPNTKLTRNHFGPSSVRISKGTKVARRLQLLTTEPQMGDGSLKRDVELEVSLCPSIKMMKCLFIYVLVSSMFS